MKHSIDTTAKLIDQVKVNLPVSGSQSPAITRIKLIAMLNATEALAWSCWAFTIFANFLTCELSDCDNAITTKNSINKILAIRHLACTMNTIHYQCKTLWAKTKMLKLGKIDSIIKI